MNETRAEQYDRMRELLNGAHCKIDGCENQAAGTRGRYAYLCELHKAEATAEQRKPSTEFSLVQLAREVERTSTELERATAAYERAVEALRRAIP